MNSKCRLFLVATLAMAFLLSTGCKMSEYKCKSMQVEAYEGLRSIQLTMEHKKADTNEYLKTTEQLKKEPTFAMREKTYYDYKIVSSDENGFVVEAHGKGDMAGDVWRVDQTGEIKAVKNKCE